MAGDWSELIVMLRRGMLAGDTDLLHATRPHLHAGVIALQGARPFNEVAGDEFRAYVGACCDAQGIRAAA